MKSSAPKKTSCVDGGGGTEVGAGAFVGVLVGKPQHGVGVPDAGVLDEGVPDAGVPDEGVPDEGVPDEGVDLDGVPEREIVAVPVGVLERLARAGVTFHWHALSNREDAISTAEPADKRGSDRSDRSDRIVVTLTAPMDRSPLLDQQ